MDIKLLDCTLRDGGYYTLWDFDRELVKTYFHAFNQLPIDYLEVGYRSTPQQEYLGEFFYCPIYMLEELRKVSDKKLVIILNEKDIRPEHVRELLQPCMGLIDMVRIALAPEHLSRAIVLAEEIKKFGFEIGFNVMYMSKWKQYGSFLEEIRKVGAVADYFYMVDSYGGVYPKDIIETINLLKERTTCKLGFHGHNNLELALINSLTAVDHGVAIIDATVTGMGRGAGNLKTELLLTALNARYGLEVNFNALSEVVDGFQKLQEQHGWGTNLPYMVSGANSLPQKDVMKWVTQRFYSFNSIIRALQNQKNKVQDNEKLLPFVPAKKYKRGLIIGGGPNAIAHLQAVKVFIQQQQDLCIIHASSKNAAFYTDIERDQFFCLVGNEGYRLEKVFKASGTFKGKCVLPPFPRKMGTFIPKAVEKNAYELKSVNFTDRLKDTHTALALQAALDCGVEEVYLVGYDGYSHMLMSAKEQALVGENDYLFAAASLQLKITSLLPTVYTVKVESVYNFIQ
jgi:4-hydroxy 2-oxovalerate aldolase